MSDTTARSDESLGETSLPAVPPRSAAGYPALSRGVPRRRSHRRRRTTQPIDWRRLTGLLVTFVLCFLLISNQQLGGLIKRSVRQYIPALSGALRPELIALALCGLILIYFVPGVEERVLKFVKGKYEQRRRQLRRERRGSSSRRRV